MKLNCTVRQASSNLDAKHYDTERIRKEYLVEKVMAPDEINMVYSMFDRIIAGGAMPVKEALLLSAPEVLRADFFTQRRELGIINVGGAGTVVVGEEEYHLEYKEALYVGRGNRHVCFKSDSADKPAHLGLRFKSTRGRGGVVRNIHIDNIYMKDILAEGVLFDLFYGGKSAVDAAADGSPIVDEPALPVDETTPEFRDIYIRDVYCNGAARAMFFNGLPEMPVSNINITNCTMTATTGIDLRNSQDISFKDVRCFPKVGAPVNTYKVKNFTNE